VFVENGDHQKAEEQLYNFVKEIISTIRANPRLTNPTSGLDPKSTRTAIIDISHIVDKRGQNIQGTSIVIQCQTGTNLQVTLPGGTVLDLLSITNSTEGFDFDANMIDNQNRIVDSTNDKGIWLLEYENTAANEAIILPLLGTTNTITLTKQGASRVINVEFIEINPTPRFDEIERAILHVEKTN
jgi:hypothetical protein